MVSRAQGRTKREEERISERVCTKMAGEEPRKIQCLCTRVAGKTKGKGGNMSDEYIIQNIDSFNKKELKSFLLEKCRENIESKDIISFIKKTIIHNCY